MGLVARCLGHPVGPIGSGSSPDTSARARVLARKLRHPDLVWRPRKDRSESAMAAGERSTPPLHAPVTFGLDPGAPGSPAALESVQRARHTVGFQLGVGDVQRPGSPWLSRTGPPRLHGPGGGHLRDRRVGRVLAREGATPGGIGLCDGRHHLRVERASVRAYRLVLRWGDGLGGLAPSLCHPRPARQTPHSSCGVLRPRRGMCNLCGRARGPCLSCHRSFRAHRCGADLGGCGTGDRDLSSALSSTWP